MPKDIEDKIKEELLPANSEKNIADKLQEINDLFLTKYKLKVDDIEIIPLETEIYYELFSFFDNCDCICTDMDFRRHGYGDALHGHHGHIHVPPSEFHIDYEHVRWQQDRPSE